MLSCFLLKMFSDKFFHFENYYCVESHSELKGIQNTKLFENVENLFISLTFRFLIRIKRRFFLFSHLLLFMETVNKANILSFNVCYVFLFVAIISYNTMNVCHSSIIFVNFQKQNCKRYNRYNKSLKHCNVHNLHSALNSKLGNV